MTHEPTIEWYKETLEHFTAFIQEQIHPDYGPCDGMGEGGNCSVCLERIAAWKAKEAPVDLLLFCPNCGEQHVDEAKPDVCETCGQSEEGCTCEVFTAWLNPPHKSHRCNFCNHVFRPADVPTNGVKEIQTKGQRDSERQLTAPVDF